ncbi:CHAT domain-containing protein [Microcoleus sp. AR_TQ3_B6]|uniref:CHAT domain-containing protein n=1 Tax=Microcoleus sp. AR_TQ3_B6 TaxID=3055284 RepID=UPI002FD270C5
MNENGDRVHSEGEDSQEYAEFILELLQAESSYSGIQVIYPILKPRQHLLNARFAETLQQVAQRLIADENPETIELIVPLIENLSIHISDFPLGNRANNIEIAITGYQIVLNNREPGSEKFAQTQNNLAVAYSNRINGSRAENLERAIEFCQAALTVRTLEDFPEYWAGTQNNLAKAYRNRINGSRAENLERAIEFYQAALTVRTLEDFPEDWATTQNNLANAYGNRINGSRAENLERAIEFFQAALTVRTLEDFREDWAMTQNNLANAYLCRINGSRAENLERAIEFYQAALTVYTLEDFPEYWATTQNNLANAYLYRINGSRAENLERAIEFFQAALTVYTLEDFREDWAMTQNNLANAYLYRINGSRIENLERAIEFYEAALTVYTFEDFPINNVETLSNLGWAYLAKLDYINQEKPEDTNQKAATLQTAYDTFKNAIAGAAKLRKLESQNETKQKHDLQWDRLYKGMVQVCLDRQSNQEALLYAEANKARNLAEVIAQKQEIPKTLAPITFSEITQLLTPNTALIEWYITNAEIITFVVTYPDVLTVHRHRQWDELTDLVAEYRANYIVSKTDWQKQLATYLQRLADILEITTILPPSSTRLILIPHWLLHLFPLHALPLTDGEFLLDRYLEGIQYAPSCQLLQQITIHPNFDQLLALQNPTSDLNYTDLEVTSIAPKFAIRQILLGDEASKTNLLEKYLDRLENAHCAHFSCHGSFNPDDPLKSFLILSGGIVGEEPPQPPLLRGEQEEEVIKVPLLKGDLGGSNLGEDEVFKVPVVEPGDPPQPPLRRGEQEVVKVPLLKGDLGGSNLDESERYVEWREGKTADINNCLTLADILLLQFKHCRLVVLSACETALIDTTNRSDYIGLPTGFLHAGAMGTLASLWAVNDLSTALIMVKFYELLQPGVSIGKALHDTQRWFKSAKTPDLVTWLKESDSFDDERKEYTEELLGRYNDDEKPYGDVYHWAAFCAIGL